MRAELGSAEEVLEYIAEHLEEWGYAPSIREICQRFEFLSTNGARHWLKKLEVRGWIKKTPLVSRGLRITEAGRGRLAEWAARERG